MASNVFGFVPEAAFLSIKNQLGGGDGYVTLNTNQTITGQKTFDTNTIFNYDIYVASVHSSFQVITTYLSSENIYASTSYLFGDGTTQITAYKSLPPGSYTTANLVVDSHGAISSISSGSSSTIANQVTMTDVSDSTVYSLCFAIGSPNGAKAVYQDYNMLTYIPNVATFEVPNANFSGVVNTTDLNVSSTLTAGFFSTNYVVGNLISNSTTNNFQISSGPNQTLDLYCNNGGTHNFMCAGSYNQSLLPLRANAAINYDPQLTLYGTDGYQQLIFNSNASSGSWNGLVTANNASIVARGSAQDNKSLAITLWSNTIMGLKLSPTNTQIRFGNQYITLDGTSVVMTSTQPITVSGYTIPANDNSSTLATTSWVQSLFAGTSQTVNFGYANFYDTVTVGSGKQSQLYQSSDTLVCKNFVPAGEIYLQCVNSLGTVTSTPLLVSSSNIVLTSSSCPTMLGYSTVSSTDSSNKIATTAWVQTALANAGIGNQVYITFQSTNSYFGILFSDAVGQTYKSVYQDSGGLQYNPSTNDLTLSSLNKAYVGKDVTNNNLFLGNTTIVSSSYADNIFIGETSQTIIIQGGINEKFLTIYNNTSAPQTYYFSSVLPQIVFLQNYNNNYGQTLYLPPVSFYYAGARIIFRKTILYLPYSAVGNWDVNITTTSGTAVFCRYDKFINLTDVNYTPQTSFGFGTGYVYVEFICDGTYWYPNALV